LTLPQHARLAELFLEALPELGLRFQQYVLNPTCETLGLDPASVTTLDYCSLVLGAAVVWDSAKLDDLEWRLVYGGHAKDYVKLATPAARIRVSGAPKPVNDIKELPRRLDLAYAAANGERRLHGATSAARLLEGLKTDLSVTTIPNVPLEKKGNYLYQDAYLL